MYKEITDKNYKNRSDLALNHKGHLQHKSSMCDGKQAHDNQQDARKQAQKGNMNRGKYGYERQRKIKLTTYLCLFCDKYHVGYPPENMIKHKNW